MGHIYRNNREIPIPPDGRVNRWDMKVSVYRQQDGRRRRTDRGCDERDDDAAQRQLSDQVSRSLE